MAMAGRILIVDDEAAVRFFLEEALTRDGHQVVAVDSGEAALALIADQEYDLALLDLMMDEVGGMEVLTALSRRWPDTVVIVLTAHASLETAVEALRQGAHDYLFKPCETVELRESVRTGLLKRQQEQGQRSACVITYDWDVFPYVSLRVDVHEQPEAELRRIYEFYKPYIPYYNLRPASPQMAKADDWVKLQAGDTG